MATDWTSFLAELRRAGAGLDPERIWRDFSQVAALSSNAEFLDQVCKKLEVARTQERTAVAFIVARLLAPIEWPAPWQPLRLGLVRGLDNLLRESDPQRPGSFAAQLGLGPGDDLFALGVANLTDARQALRIPCRKDEIPIIASVCNTGVWALLRSCRYALAATPPAAIPPAIGDARVAFLFAFSQYADAARGLNDALGAPVLTHLEAPLGTG